jgi:hypothetical protein
MDFRPIHANRNKQYGCVYNKPRKKYIRKNPYPTQTMHIKPLLREKCAIVKLSNFGYTINQIATVLARSTSFVHRVVRKNITLGSIRFIDKRKLPSQIRLATSARRMTKLQNMISGWMAFILGEVDRPP